MPKAFHHQDRYFHKAKKQGYRARSVFKLDEIQDRFSFIRSGDKVLDLGAAPGSFLQKISEYVGKRGTAVGIDLQEIKDFSAQNVSVFQCDIFHEEEMKRILQSFSPFDVITSDLAPKTTGIRDIDQFASIELNIQAFEISKFFLKKNGYLLLKVFSGSDLDNFIQILKKSFRKVIQFKPKACRDRSFELYLVCMDFRRERNGTDKR